MKLKDFELLSSLNDGFRAFSYYISAFLRRTKATKIYKIPSSYRYVNTAQKLSKTVLHDEKGKAFRASTLNFYFYHFSLMEKVFLLVSIHCMPQLSY
jgi:hypothetical protein